MKPAAIVIVAVLILAGRPHAEAAETACTSAKCINLLFDGDSISVGSGAPPGQGLAPRVTAVFGPDVRMNNVAANGRPVIACLQLYPRLVAPLYDPSTPHNVIVFHAGDNDIAQGRDAAQTYAAFTAYVAAAHQQGWKIVVSTELPRWPFNTPRETELLAYNALLRQNKAGADAIVDFDADPRMTDMAYRQDPAVFSHDRIHPSAGGYAILAAMLAPVVARVAGR